jgi:hypothetical protein
MGFFSWDCKCCGESMKEGNDWMGDVVIVGDDGSVIRGKYDGYGRVESRVGEVEIVEADGHFACYHAKCYALAGKPEYTGPSRSANDQGCGESEIEPHTMADVEAIKARRVERDAQKRAEKKAYYTKAIAELEAKGEEVPDYMRAAAFV